jgi:hypothetical protein
MYLTLDTLITFWIVSVIMVYLIINYVLDLKYYIFNYLFLPVSCKFHKYQNFVCFTHQWEPIPIIILGTWINNGWMTITTSLGDVGPNIFEDKLVHIWIWIVSVQTIDSFIFGDYCILELKVLRPLNLSVLFSHLYNLTYYRYMYILM